MPRNFRLRFGRLWSSQTTRGNYPSSEDNDLTSTEISDGLTERTTSPADSSVEQTTFTQQNASVDSSLQTETPSEQSSNIGTPVDPPRSNENTISQQLVTVLLREDNGVAGLSRLLGNQHQPRYHYIWSDDATVAHNIWSNSDSLREYLTNFRYVAIRRPVLHGISIEATLVPLNGSMPHGTDLSIYTLVAVETLHAMLYPSATSPVRHTSRPLPITPPARSRPVNPPGAPRRRSMRRSSNIWHPTVARLPSPAPSPPLESSSTSEELNYSSSLFSSSSSESSISISERNDMIRSRSIYWRQRTTRHRNEESDEEGTPFRFPNLPNLGVHEYNLFVPPSYVLGPIIGEGEFSKVRMACNLETNAAVAVKVYRRRRGNQSCAIDEQIMREIDMVKGLICHNIVKVFETVVHGDRVFMIMEIMTKGDLRKYINRNGALAEKQTRRFFLDIVNGVSYLHRRNIVHLDLKLENLLLNQAMTVKITDFGCARLQMGQKRFSIPCGSYAYGAPEVISGQMYDGKKADVWSVGVVLYCMAVARLPYSDDGQLADLMWERRKPPLKSELMSPMLMELIEQMLMYRSEQRISLSHITTHQWLMVGHKKRPQTKLITLNN